LAQLEHNLAELILEGASATSDVGAGRLTITDGASGRTVLDIDFKDDDSHSINIPDYGIRCENDVLITAMTNITAMTVFYS
jgi:hypothetical protein